MKLLHILLLIKKMNWLNRNLIRNTIICLPDIKREIRYVKLIPINFN